MIRDSFVGDDNIMLPVTFDYKGGRSGNLKSQLLLTSATSLVVVLASLVIFSMTSKTLELRFVYFIFLLIVYAVFLRFFVFKEKRYRRYIEDVEAVNKKDSFGQNATSNTYWSIFDISEDYPYECSYIDGRRGIFVALAKDIFVGKGDDIVTRHYDAVSDAYNTASRLQVDVISVDYMDEVGNDTRIKGLYGELAHSNNEGLKAFVGSLYKGLMDDMSNEFASYDVYCFVTGNRNLDLYRAMQSIVTELLNGNYVAYKVLDESAIRQLCGTLTNNENFSLIEAKERVLRVSSYRSFKPLFLVDENNNVIYFDEQGELQRDKVGSESSSEDASDIKYDNTEESEGAFSEYAESDSKDSEEEFNIF